jgi:hypothetical protein
MKRIFQNMSFVEQNEREPRKETEYPESRENWSQFPVTNRLLEGRGTLFPPLAHSDTQTSLIKKESAENSIESTVHKTKGGYYFFTDH